MFVSLALSMLSMLKRTHAASMVELLSLDKGVFLVLLNAVPLFLFFMWQNASVNYYDENSYLGSEMSSIFWADPKRWLQLRTYGYSSLVVSAKVLFGPVGAKIAVCIGQLLLFLLTCVWVRNVSWKGAPPIRLSRWFPLFLVVTNLYLIQATSLFLTDIMAACLIAIGISAIIYLPLIRLVVACSVGVLTFAGMVRPAALCFLISMPIIYLIRWVHENDIFNVRKFLRPLPVAIVAFCIVVFPQLMINQNCSPTQVRFPIVVDLAKMQGEWGRQVLKYETCVNKSLHEPWMCYQIPSWLKQIPGGVKVGHIVAMFDQGEVNAYKRSFDSVGRRCASFLYYLYMWLAMVGIVSMLRRSQKLELVLLCLAVSPYIIMMASCAVESRFAYPCILLAIPLVVQGVRFISDTQLPWKRALLALCWGTWEFVAFKLSYWLDTLLI